MVEDAESQVESVSLFPCRQWGVVEVCLFVVFWVFFLPASGFYFIYLF